MAEGFDIRPFEPTDLRAVLELLRLSLGETPATLRTPELFAWKHERNPFGVSIMLVATAGGQVAGFRALMRWRLVGSSAETIESVRAVDTATHPEYRRRGVFRALTLAAIDAARTQGIQLVFNTPNPRSASGYLTMGWTEVGRIGILVRPTRRLLTGRRHQNWDTVSTAQDSAALGHLERRPRGLRTPRTHEYLRWRYSHPHAAYRIVEAGKGGAIVRPNIRAGRRELVVSDLYGPRSAGALRRAIRMLKADYAVAWFSPGSPERKEARRAGLLLVPRLSSFRLVALPLLPVAADVHDLRNWDLAISDLELL